ncbi:hypothetical protein ACM614_03220 [Streptomyces sp. 12297]
MSGAGTEADPDPGAGLDPEVGLDAGPDSRSGSRVGVLTHTRVTPLT